MNKCWQWCKQGSECIGGGRNIILEKVQCLFANPRRNIWMWCIWDLGKKTTKQSSMLGTTQKQLCVRDQLLFRSLKDVAGLSWALPPCFCNTQRVCSALALSAEGPKQIKTRAEIANCAKTQTWAHTACVITHHYKRKHELVCSRQV